jgi:hypothetical protein
MGTSASNSGPKNKTPLLPAWAQGDLAASPESPGEPMASASDGANLPPDNAPPSSTLAALDVNQSEPTTSPNTPADGGGSWTLARRAMTSAVKGTGSGSEGTGRLQTAARRYVSAKGGAKKAASAAAAGRSTTARIGDFISAVVARGFTEAARVLGLQNTVGKKVDAVLAAVINAIAPAGTNNDNAIARRAASETLREIFEKYGVQESGLDALNAMTPADVTDAIELSVAGYVYQRWLFDLSQRIEQNAVSESDAVRLERDVKAYVTGLVKLKLDGKKAIQLDWKGAQGKKFIQDIYEAAYKLLGGTA